MSCPNSSWDARAREWPRSAFSGFDGRHEFKVPIAAFPPANVSVTWQVSDPTLAKLEPEPGGTRVMLSTLRSGYGVVHATGDNGWSASTSLTVIGYSPEQYEAGRARWYESSGPDPACAQCHGVSTGPDETPSEISSCSDAWVQAAFTEGRGCDGNPIDSMHEFTMLLNGSDHKFSPAQIERVGLVAFMRALTPLGFPEDPDAAAGQ